jgi:hypothetical protein
MNIKSQAKATTFFQYQKFIFTLLRSELEMFMITITCIVAPTLKRSILFDVFVLRQVTFNEDPIQIDYSRRSVSIVALNRFLNSS